MEPIRSEYESDADMLEIVREFAAELPERADTLESLLAQAELEELQRVAHQLKGAGGGYGFPQITATAAELERALKDGAAEALVKERTALVCETLRAVCVPEGEGA